MFSCLPQPAVVVQVSEPPRCHLLKDPPSFIKEEEEESTYKELKIYALHWSSRVCEGAASCEGKQEETLKRGGPENQNRTSRTGTWRRTGPCKNTQTIMNKNLKKQKVEERPPFRVHHFGKHSCLLTVHAVNGRGLTHSGRCMTWFVHYRYL